MHKSEVHDILDAMTYHTLLNKTIELYLKEDFTGAYDFITANKDTIPVSNDAQICNFRYSIAGKAGKPELAMDLFREAIEEKKYWYQYDYLIEDEDLEPLKAFPDFDRLVSICRERETAAKNQETPGISIIESGTAESAENLFIPLHGDQENMEIAGYHWSTAVPGNTILAVPQSSQTAFSEAYVWKDLQKGIDEFQSHFEDLRKKYADQVSSIIGAGFSAGARVLVNAVAQGFAGLDGIILLGPWLPEEKEQESFINALAGRKLKIFIMCGDKDDDCFDCTNQFTERLDNAGISHIYKILPGLMHEYPDTLKTLTEKAFSYIKGES